VESRSKGDGGLRRGKGEIEGWSETNSTLGEGVPQAGIGSQDINMWKWKGKGEHKLGIQRGDHTRDGLGGRGKEKGTHQLEIPLPN